MPTLVSELIMRLKDEVTKPAGKAASALDKIRGAEATLAESSRKLESATNALAKFRGLEVRLGETTKALRREETALKDLGQRILGTTGPTRRLEEAFKRTELAVKHSREEMVRQQRAAAELQSSFERLSGGPLHSVASAEDTLRKRIESTTAALRHQATESGRVIRAEEGHARRRAKLAEAFSGIGGLAGPVILQGAADSVKAGAEVQHERVEMSKAGMAAMIPGVEKQALELAALYRNVTQVAIMEMAKEARSVLTKPQEVAEILPALAAAKSVLDARDSSGGESSALGLLVKGAENLGAGQNPKRMVELIDGYVKAMQVMGKTINPEEIFAFAKNARLAGAKFSDRFLMTTAMSTLQELGGESAGKAANEAVSQMTSGLGKRTVAVKQLLNLGLVDRKDVAFNKIGEVSGVRKGVLHPVKQDSLLASDPDLWVYQVLLPAMEAHGIKSSDDQIAAIRQIFSGSKSAQDLVGKLLTQRESYTAHAGMYPTAAGLKGAELNKDDPLAGLSGLTHSLETFAGVLTSPIMLPAAHALDFLSGKIGEFSKAFDAFAKEHPELAKGIAGVALAGGAYEGSKLTYGLFQNIGKLFGGGTQLAASATALDASATALGQSAAALDAAAARLGGGAVPGAGAPGGAQPGSPGSNGLGWRGALAAFNLVGAALMAPDLSPEGTKQREANFGALDRLGDSAKGLLGLTWLERKMRGVPESRTKDDAIRFPGRPFEDDGRASRARPADADPWFKDLLDKTKDAVWQFGALNDSSGLLKASFTEVGASSGSSAGGLLALSQAAAAATAKLSALANFGGDGTVGGGSGGGIIKASWGGGGGRGGDGSYTGAATVGLVGEHADYIRKVAAQLGIDPKIALGVAKSEGLGAGFGVGDHGTSFGDFQLHYAGRVPGTTLPGLGEAFTRATGLSGRDPANWKAMDRFALGWAAKHGWGDWHGAAHVGIGPRQGIGKRPTASPDSDAFPRRPAGKGGGIEARNGSSRIRVAYHPTVTVHVHGGEHVDHDHLANLVVERMHAGLQSALSANFADV